MNVKTNWETYTNCNLVVNKYAANNSLCLEIFNPTEGPIARITVCLSGKVGENEAYVDTNNCPWAEDFIEEYKLGEDTGKIGFSGFCTYPLYKFNIDAINKYI